MRYGVEYQKKSEEAYVQEQHQRMEKNLRRRAKELGYELKKIEAALADPSGASTLSM